MTNLIRTKTRWLAWGPVFFMLAALGPWPDALAEPSLANELLSIHFDARTGALSGFTDRLQNHEFAVPAPDESLWTLDFLGDAGPVTITPAQARTFEWLEPKPRTLRLVWKHFEPIQGLPLALQSLRVNVTVALPDANGESRWTLDLEGTAAASPAAIHFPRLPAIAEQEEETLAVPVWMGERAKNPRDQLCGPSGGRLEWEYPGLLSMQCLALYRKNGPGLYLACDDTKALYKRFAVFGAANRKLGFELIERVPATTAIRENRPASFHAILGAFKGDWLTVAERYRRWALHQPWAKKSRLRNGATADWVMNTGLWVWNRGRSEGVLTPALVLQEQAQVPVSVFWHWWHGCAYDTGFPEYLPPREGAGPFRAALGEAHDRGIHALVYMNQRLWGMTTESWTNEGAERYAVKSPDGTVRPEVYNTFNKAPCASMCMGTSFWRNKYAGIATQAVTQLGIDGIYMDQACTSLACFDPSHEHPLGGGSYWMRGFHQLQADIRERCRPARKVVLAGEGCGETWLPYLDLMLSLQVSMERYAAPGIWEPIPFFHAVYHGYGVFFGNYSSLARPPYDELWPAEFAPKEPLKTLDQKFAGQFRLEQARACVWGQQPMLANFVPRQCEERASEVAYTLRLAKLRYAARKYLLYGTLLSTFENAGVPELTTPEPPMDFSRLSIYAGQRDAVKEFQKATPPALASAWRAPDNSIAVIVANITDRPLRFQLPTDSAWHEHNKGSSRVYDANGLRATVRLQEGRIPIELGPEEACVYEIVPNRDRNTPPKVTSQEGHADKH